MMLLKILSRFPFWVLYGLSDFIFFFGFHIIRYRRGVVSMNLSRSFPEKNRRELKQIEKRFYKNMCDYVVETLKLLTISQEELSKRMVYINPGLLREYTDRHRSIILFQYSVQDRNGNIFIDQPFELFNMLVDHLRALEELVDVRLDLRSAQRL